MLRRKDPKLGRNEKCHCGSDKKYKHCCLSEDLKPFREASIEYQKMKDEQKRKRKEAKKKKFKTKNAIQEEIRDEAEKILKEKEEKVDE